MGRKRKPDRLDIESKKATEAGMSYGRWKALQKPDVIVPPKPKKMIEMKCEVCGKVFYQTDKRNRKYCGDECRQVASYEQRTEYARKWYEDAENADKKRRYMRKYSEEYRRYEVSKL